jgi:pimeloyl-ACP methyl ester carboxylesterase
MSASFVADSLTHKDGAGTKGTHPTPAAALIMGASGDGGVFERFGDVLADEFTGVTYDRRGNGRSPRPPGWDTTSPEEQADDAAALLDALGLAPAAVFGTSSGGIFALAMLLRHPDRVRSAILDYAGFRAPTPAHVKVVYVEP